MNFLIPDSDAMVDNFTETQTSLDGLSEIIKAINLHEQNYNDQKSEQISLSSPLHVPVLPHSSQSSSEGKQTFGPDQQNLPRRIAGYREMTLIRNDLFEPAEVQLDSLDDTSNRAERESSVDNSSADEVASAKSKQGVQSPDRCSDVSLAEEVMDDSLSAVDDVICGGGGDDILVVTSSSRALIVSNSPPTDNLIILAQPVAEDVESENSNTESHDECVEYDG